MEKYVVSSGNSVISEYSNTGYSSSINDEDALLFNTFGEAAIVAIKINKFLNSDRPSYGVICTLK